MRSLADIKEKQIKGKKNALPKLINILGDPYKKHWPLLKENELKQFCYLMQTAIALSGQTPREFAKSKCVRIGLESSLRAINSCQTSCVFISLSLKPHYLIGLVARNMEAKDATVPVYAQHKLEDLTQELLGIRALILVLPKNANTLSTDLGKWVATRTKQPCSAQSVQVIPPTKRKRNASSPPIAMSAEFKKPALAGPTTIAEEDKEHNFKGDFISFTQGEATVDYHQEQEQLQDDKAKLTVVLSKLAAQAKLEQMPVQSQLCAVNVDGYEASAEETRNSKFVNDTDSDETMAGKYKQLTVLHLTPNPNKTKRKKKTKKKNKNKEKTQ